MRHDYLFDADLAMTNEMIKELRGFITLETLILEYQ